MTSKEIYDKIASLNTQAMEAIDKAGEVRESDEAVYNEKRAEAKKILDQITSLKEDAKLREAIEKDQERENVKIQAQRDNHPGFNGRDVTSDNLNREPTPEFLRERSTLLDREYGGENLSDEERSKAFTTFPVEALYHRAVLDKHPKGREALIKLGAFTNEDREAYAKYEDIQTRAIAPTMQAGTAALGGTLVPETLLRRIYARMRFFGPMNDTTLVTRHTNNTTGDFKIPTVTNNIDKKAQIVAEGADATRDTIATGVVTVKPYKYTFQIPVTYELLVGW